MSDSINHFRAVLSLRASTAPARFVCPALALLFLAIVQCAMGNPDVTFSTADLLGRTYTNRSMIISPVSGPFIDGTNVIASQSYTTNTGTGSIVISDMVSGTYRVSIYGTPATTFLMTVPTGDDALSASALIVNNPPAVNAVANGILSSYYVRHTNGNLVSPTNFFRSNLVAGTGMTITYDSSGKPTLTASGGTTNFGQIVISNAPTLDSNAVRLAELLVVSNATINAFNLPSDGVALDVPTSDGLKPVTHGAIYASRTNVFGWKYWLIYSGWPNITGVDREQTYLAVSQNGVDWVNALGGTNRLFNSYTEMPSGGTFFADPEIILRTNNTFIAYTHAYSSVADTNILMAKTSADGTNWSSIFEVWRRGTTNDPASVCAVKEDDGSIALYGSYVADTNSFNRGFMRLLMDWTGTNVVSTNYITTNNFFWHGDVWRGANRYHALWTETRSDRDWGVYGYSSNGTTWTWLTNTLGALPRPLSGPGQIGWYKVDAVPTFGSDGDTYDLLASGYGFYGDASLVESTNWWRLTWIRDWSPAKDGNETNLVYGIQVLNQIERIGHATDGAGIQHGILALQSYSLDFPFIGFNTHFADGEWRYISNAPAAAVINSAGSFQIRTYTNGTNGQVINTFNPQIKAEPSGLVGLGGTSGSSSLTDNTGYVLVLTNGSGLLRGNFQINSNLTAASASVTGTNSNGSIVVTNGGTIGGAVVFTNASPTTNLVYNTVFKFNGLSGNISTIQGPQSANGGGLIIDTYANAQGFAYQDEANRVTMFFREDIGILQASDHYLGWANAADDAGNSPFESGFRRGSAGTVRITTNAAIDGAIFPTNGIQWTAQSPIATALPASTAGLFATNNSGTLEVAAFGGDGVATQLTSHPKDSPGSATGVDDGIDFPYIIKHSWKYTGETEWIHLSALAREVERLSGKRFIFATTNAAVDWTAEQQALRNESLAARAAAQAAYDAEVAAGKTNAVLNLPPLHVIKPEPQHVKRVREAKAKKL